MDRHDPIIDDTPNKRRKLNPQSSSGKAWDSQDDSGEEFTAEDFQSVATLPASETQKRRLAYSAERMHNDLGTSSSQRSYMTQPTQTLNRATQPTQPLPPRKPSEVQVERSSPMGPSTQTQTQTQKAMPRPQFSKPGGVLASAMAPAGTSFRRPINAQPKPAPIALDSDEEDPPVEHSDDETQGLSSTIRPTNFTRAGRGLDSSPNRVQESPRSAAPPPAKPNAFASLLGEFGYQPPQTARRPADDMASAYSTSRGPRPLAPARQTGPARAMPASSDTVYKTLDDIPDYILRRKVSDIKKVLGELVTIDACMDALTKKKGNHNDAMDYLADLEAKRHEPDEIASLSPIHRKGVAKSTSHSQSQSSSSSQPVRPMAKQTVQAPVKSIAQRYGKGSKAITVDSDSDEDEDEEEDVKPKRGRIIQGRKPTMSSSPPSSPPPRSRLLNKKVITIDDSDSEDDSGVVRDEAPPPPVRSSKAAKYIEPEVIQASVQELREKRLLKLMNESTAHALSEVCGQSEETIAFVLEKRPFNSLDDVYAVVKENFTKTGKKSKKTTPIGEKLVDDCREVMTGYDAIDELVVQCEKIAQPVQEALRGWGVGEAGADGELQLMKLDEVHDSGIGTPASSYAADDIPLKSTKTKGNFVGQPSNMNPEMTMKDYQLVGLNWLCLLFKKKLSSILADDMGLGKTCQIIAFLSHLQLQKVDGVHLIIVPGSTLENWLREFDRFSPGLNVKPYYGKQDERADLRYEIEQEWGSLDAIVTTYDMIVSKDDNAFFRAQGPFSCCIYDEAHALRNPNSLRYQQLVRIKADFKVLLTGTPLQNNLQELIAILAFIMPEMFQEKREDLEYIFKHKASTKDTSSAALLSNDRISRARTMMTPFILRRKKHQVLDLPTKTSRVEFCDMTDTQANHYADVIEDAQRFYNDKATGAVKGSAKKTSNVIMALRKAAIHPLLSRRIYDDKKLDRMVAALGKSDEFGGNPPDKILAYLNGEASISLKGGDFGLHKFSYERDFLRKKFALKKQEWMDSGKAKKFAELVKQYADNGDRVLVFSQFTTLMDILEAVLETLQIKFMRLDGTTQIQERQDMIDKFTEDTSITVFMLSTRAGGAGINLAAANKVIIHDSGFNPQDDIQAENRAHRVGQTRPVEVVRLVTRGTIEEQVHALGESKLALDDRVAGDGHKEAEKAGEQMVEQMLAKKLSCDKGSEQVMEGDLKDAFKQGLEGEGLKVSSRQAQF